MEMKIDAFIRGIGTICVVAIVALVAVACRQYYKQQGGDCCSLRMVSRPKKSRKKSRVFSESNHIQI